MILIDLRGACDARIISHISKHLPVNKNKRRLLFKPIENTLFIMSGIFYRNSTNDKYSAVVRNEKRIKRVFTSVQTNRRIIFIFDNVRLFVFSVDICFGEKNFDKLDLKSNIINYISPSAAAEKIFLATRPAG